MANMALTSSSPPKPAQFEPTPSAHAVKIIVELVPPGPDRTVAIRKIREARMDANSALTFGGKY